MSTNTRIALPDEILMKICRMVGLKEATCTISLLSKDMLSICSHAYLPPGVEKKFPNGRLPDDLGRSICFMLDSCRLAVFNLGCSSHLSKAAHALLERTQDVNELRARGLHADIGALNGGMYTYWHRTPQPGSEGTFHILRETAKLNPDLGLERYIERDAIHWKNDRIREDFILLLERKDGTILCSLDLKRFYLVLGLSQSMATSMSLLYPGFAPYEASPDRRTIHNGFVLGMRISATLLNVDSAIVYDTLLAPIERMSERRVKAAVKAYIRAVDTGTLITSLSLTPIVGSAQLPVESLDSESFVSIERLKKAPYNHAPASKIDMWVFRRFGYTEETNPNHLVCPMMGAMPMFPEAFLQLRSLRPTMNEYIAILERGVREVARHKPSHIGVDEDTLVGPLSEALKDTGIIVSYYPPPSDEEADINDATNPYLIPRQQYLHAPRGKQCFMCGAAKTSKGEELLQCGRCKDSYYCSKTHQKMHWKMSHKSECVDLS